MGERPLGHHPVKTAPRGRAGCASLGPGHDGGMSAALLIRPMQEADLDAVLDLEPQLFGSGAWSRATYEAELSHPGRRYVVVEQDDQVAGYAGIDLADEATVMTVGVAPAHRRRGFGRLMIREILALARAHGSTQVHLEVRADDAGAQALYASFGFTPVGRRRGYYQGTDALTMRLRLQIGRAASRERVSRTEAPGTEAT